MKKLMFVVVLLGIAFTPTCFADDSDAAGAGMALAGIALIILGIVVAIAWLVFPFIVISKCNQMIRELKMISGDTAQLIRSARAPNRETSPTAVPSTG
jgi:cytochrome bd-type quinol oxidase subunit 2